jgi:hypothetical protein
MVQLLKPETLTELPKNTMRVSVARRIASLVHVDSPIHPRGGGSDELVPAQEVTRMSEVEMLWAQVEPNDNVY